MLLTFTPHAVWAAGYGDFILLYAGVTLLPCQATRARALPRPGVAGPPFALTLCQEKRGGCSSSAEGPDPMIPPCPHGSPGEETAGLHCSTAALLHSKQSRVQSFGY